MLFVPTFPDVPNYTMSPTFDGVQYLLGFRFSEREACYYLDLSLSDGTLLIAGKKIVVGVSLWKRHRYNTLVPQNHLVCGASTGQSQDPPTIGELGSGRRCSLFYFTKAEWGA
jgi:hypothetical protein